MEFVCCVSLPKATISSVPIYDIANEHEELEMGTEHYYSFVAERASVDHYSCIQMFKCPYCKSRRIGNTFEEAAKELMKRVEANNYASVMSVLANCYYHGCRFTAK
jgi:hypothetical protein